MYSFRSKSSDRWSDRLTHAGLVDMALRGTEEQWWELYHAARQDAELRALLARLLRHADPDLPGGRRLWLALLDRMAAASDPPVRTP
ncbi:MAG: hypothetical protein M5U12_33165 [Verrucomicrobia bacterium]|nr:hypothetical protein [Verrucomicrobiota bacterium]